MRHHHALRTKSCALGREYSAVPHAKQRLCDVLEIIHPFMDAVEEGTQRFVHIDGADLSTLMVQLLWRTSQKNPKTIFFLDVLPPHN